MPPRTIEAPVSSPLVPAVLRFVRERGGDFEIAALRAGIEANAIDADEAATPPGAFARLLDAAADLLDEPSLALRLPTELSFQRYRFAELAAIASATVGEGLRRMTLYASAWMPGTTGSVEEVNERFAVHFATPGSPRGLGHVAHEYVLASALTLARQMAGTDIRAARVWFANARPRRVESLEHFFGTRDLSFGAEDSGIAWAHLDAARRSIRADARLVATLEPLATRELAEANDASSFAHRVAIAIERSLPDTRIESVARRVHASVRTLQRRLDDDGANYSSIVDGVRKSLAQRCLVDETRTIADIATQLGFADVASFGRAFKRWTGTSPGAFRRSMYAGPGRSTGMG